MLPAFAQPLLALLVLNRYAFAYPSYRYRIPNAFGVSCPEGVSGCLDGDESNGQPQKYCGGIGHMSCAGHDQLNPFGIDWKAAEHEWTKELCEKDSDGDGFTNGEELGDPCCLWNAYDKPSLYMQTFTPSHPGFAHHKQSVNYTRPNCTSDVEKQQPVLRAPMLNAFNDDEERRTVDFVVDSYEIPAEPTTYVNMVFNFDDVEGTDKFHVVYGEAIVDQPEYLHHMTFLACGKKFPDKYLGKPFSSSLDPFEMIETMEKYECRNNVWAAGVGWAPGNTIAPAPLFAGRPLGAGFGIASFLVNFHYNNPSSKAGVISRDGFRLYYTPTLRDETMGGFDSIAIALANPLVRWMHPRSWFKKDMHIPPKKDRFFVTRTCELERVDAKSVGEMHVAMITYHGHLLAREMSTRVNFASGKSIDFGSEPIWWYDDQFQRNMMLENVSLRAGDSIQSTCVYNSNGRDDSTAFGENTFDEMCFASFHVWPINHGLQCKGPIWMGELADEEKAADIKTCHPVENAVDKWEGPDHQGLFGFTHGKRIHDSWFGSNGVSVPESCFTDDSLVSAGHLVAPALFWVVLSHFLRT